MKKILSFILATAMLLSMIIVVSIPATAADGEWTTYASPDTYGENDDGTPKTPIVAGFKYTADGFTTVDADWSGNNPFVTAQTKAPVNFENGIYLKVCVDRFAYEDNDAWININFWDSQNIKPGSAGYGQGIQTLIRPHTDDVASGEWYYDYIEWWAYEWIGAGTSYFKDTDGNDVKLPVEDGKITFELELKNEDGKYTLNINGAAAPDSIVYALTDIFTEGEAYIGVTLYNSTYESVAGLTILEFGTCKEDAITPDGDDSRAPQNAEFEPEAEIADPSTVPAGVPAIFMTGNKESSHTSAIAAYQGDTFTIEDDFSVRVLDTNGDMWNSSRFSVKSSVSYDIDDFPVMCFLTKNFCTCDDPMDCYATEEVQAYLMAGKGRAPGSGGCAPVNLDVCWDPIVIDEGENAGSYLYFYYDTSSADALEFAGGEGGPRDWTGRIHAVQMEFLHLSADATRSAINIEWVAFFRSVEEAKAYIFSSLGVEDDGSGDATTELPGDVTTEASGNVTTEAKGEEKTEAKGEEKTEAKGDDNVAINSCGSVIGTGAVAVVALVATAGAVLLRKKED